MAFSYYKTFTVDYTQAGTSDSTNFPVTIFVTDTDLKTTGNGGYVQNTNGYDIRPYSDSALTTALTYELVNYTASTGVIEMHVKIPTLSSSANVTYYLAFGDAAISTDGTSNTTWDSNFKGVWHLGDGSTIGLSDSTSNAYTLTNNGTVTAATGQIKGGTGTLDGTSQYLSNASLSITTGSSVTISFWQYQSSAALGTGTWDIGHATEPNRFGAHGPYSDNVVYWDYGDIYASPVGRVSSSYSSYTNAWTLLTFVYVVGTGLKLYFNGSSVATNASTGTPATSTGINIGRYTLGGSSYYSKAQLDEFRVSNVARSSSWITAEYNNQKSSSTFLTWGSKVATATNPTITGISSISGLSTITF